ncbi:Dolichyl-phosphate-mannose--protein mannosyltransferase 4, partial [Massospora cicadina]
MTLFRVTLEGQAPQVQWLSHVHLVKLLHLETPVVVWAHRKPLPDWGLNQYEVNGNKKLDDSGNLWFVDEIMGVNNTFVEKPPTRRSFLLKFLELQAKMLAKNSQISAHHPFATRPWQWPFTLRGCSYWTRDATKEQIYLLGNPPGYWLSAIVAILFLVYLAVDQVFLRRGVDTLRPSFRRRVYRSGRFFLLAYLLHYLPFFPMGRQLFLHHYLPALIFKYLLLGAAFQYAFFPAVDVSNLQRSVAPTRRGLKPPTSTSALAWVAAATLMLMQLAAFAYFAPFTYGSSLAGRGQVYSRKWLPTWDFHFAKPATANDFGSAVPAPEPAGESPISQPLHQASPSL